MQSVFFHFTVFLVLFGITHVVVGSEINQTSTHVGQPTSLQPTTRPYTPSPNFTTPEKLPLNSSFDPVPPAPEKPEPVSMYVEDPIYAEVPPFTPDSIASHAVIDPMPPDQLDNTLVSDDDPIENDIVGADSLEHDPFEQLVSPSVNAPTNASAWYVSFHSYEDLLSADAQVLSFYNYIIILVLFVFLVISVCVHVRRKWLYQRCHTNNADCTESETAHLNEKQVASDCKVDVAYSVDDGPDTPRR
jgi:hypothetical protein